MIRSSSAGRLSSEGCAKHSHNDLKSIGGKQYKEGKEGKNGFVQEIVGIFLLVSLAVKRKI